MDSYLIVLKERIKKLEDLVKELKEELDFALQSINTNPAASLNGSRKSLEFILKESFKKEMGEELEESGVGKVLDNPEYKRKVDSLIYAKMASIRHFGNVGSHFGTHPAPKDAFFTLDAICDILVWFLKKYKDYNIEIEKKEHQSNKFKEIKADYHAKYIEKIFRNYVFWEKILLHDIFEKMFGETPGLEHIHSQPEWSESIYSDCDNIYGISVPFHDGNAFIVCVLQRFDTELKFRFAVLYKELGYNKQVDFINKQFTELGLQDRSVKGYYEGFKFIPFSNGDPEAIIKNIKSEIENVLR